MLAIRLQRVGRTGYATYRLAVQEARRHPSSGRIVAYVGIYNPHTKEAKVQVELAQKYLDNGAQPTPRVIKLLRDAGVKLPSWVQKADVKTKAIRNIDKLRKNRPKVEKVEIEEPAEELAIEEPIPEIVKPEEIPTEAPVEAEAMVDETTGETASEELAETIEK